MFTTLFADGFDPEALGIGQPPPGVGSGNHGGTYTPPWGAETPPWEQEHGSWEQDDDRYGADPPSGMGGFGEPGFGGMGGFGR